MSATIAAIGTPPGAGQRGVIRISGPRSEDVVRAALGIEGALGARGARHGRLFDGVGRQPALLLWMPAPHSYTREDTAELHLSGSPALLARALERVIELGCEPARPGEFTRRAFLNGRLDLTRAEGVLTLVQARNEEERRSAQGLFFGGLEQRVGELREALVDLRALCEASLDFDESDAGHVGSEELARRGQAALRRVDEALSWEERREPLSGVPRVCLVGAPNAGKSTLFNRLSGGQALVSSHSRTTRDMLRGVWPLGDGRACQLFDTAGIDPGLGASAPEPDRAARDMTLAALRAADLLLWVVDAARPESADPESVRSQVPTLLVWNKVDSGSSGEPPPELLARASEVVSVSGRTGQGLAQIAARVRALLGDSGGPAGSGLGRELTVRHRAALRAAREELGRAVEMLQLDAPLDLVAEALRAATDALDQITGQTTPEDLLDRIFARFCLGK
jgi:tRNA modification GTPase